MVGALVEWRQRIKWVTALSRAPWKGAGGGMQRETIWEGAGEVTWLRARKEWSRRQREKEKGERWARSCPRVQAL